MFDVGFTEILLIGIVALVVIGPERLPAVAKTAGQWIAKLQRFVRGVKTDLASELQSGDLKKLIGDQREQINELKNMVSSAKKDFESSTRDVVQGAKKSLGELESNVKELDGDSARKDKSMPAPGDPPQSGSETVATQVTSASHVKAASVSSETDKTGSSTTVNDEVSAMPASESVSPLQPGTDGGHQATTMRTDSHGSLDDSAGRNRTGTESGN